MSTTSQKHRNFVAEPMGNKKVTLAVFSSIFMMIVKVTEMAGIGPKLGKRLSDEGFDMAYCVLGLFLLFKKNKEHFVDWLKVTGDSFSNIYLASGTLSQDIAQANARQAENRFNCIND